MPGTNLTRHEAEERYAVVKTHSYDIALDLTGGPETFSSRTVARFSATPGASTFLDLIADYVARITLNGLELSVAAFADSRIQLAGLEAENEVVVEATCRYTNTGEGLHRFKDPVDQEVYLYSQFQVADARRVFAVFEQPDLKARFTFTVTAPAHWQVISNEAGVREEGPDGATWRFAATPPISSYITAIVAGPYKSVHSTLTSSDGREIALGLYARASLAEFLEAEEIFDVTRRGFEFFERSFDYPYPFAKYDQLFVPEFNAGAMENAGCVTFTEKLLFRSKVSQAVRERRVITVLHELAHMWFGDLVTMKWWNDLWLNESFAEFMSALAAAEATEWTGAWTTFNTLEKSWAYSQDQLPSTHPIVAEISDLHDVEVNFDGITYAKGASVLRQLVAWVGQDEFLAGVARYLREHEWGNTVLSDLMGKLEEASGRDLEGWSELWLETAGVATLRPEFAVELHDGVPTLTSFALRQVSPAKYPTLRPHRLAVSGYEVEGDRLERRVRLEVDIAGELTEIPGLLGKARPDLILVNDDDLAYAKIRLDEDSLAVAVRHLAGFDDSLPGALILSAAWDMTRDGEWSASRFAELVLSALGANENSTVVMMMLRQLETAVKHYSAPGTRAALADSVCESLICLARGAEGGTDLQFQLVKGAAAFASSPRHLDVIEAWRSGEEPLDQLVIDTDLSWELLTSLVAGGRAGGEDIENALAADATANGQQAAAKARAAQPQAEAKSQAWEAIAGGGLPNAIQLATILGFQMAWDRSLLAPFVEPYLALLENIWEDRSPEMAEQVAAGAFPLPLAGLTDLVDVVARTDQWLEDHQDVAPALRRLVVESLDATRRAVRAQAVDR